MSGLQCTNHWPRLGSGRTEFLGYYYYNYYYTVPIIVTTIVVVTDDDANTPRILYGFNHVKYVTEWIKSTVVLFHPDSIWGEVGTHIFPEFNSDTRYY